MTRLRKLLAAAAALVLSSGLALSLALQQAAQTQDPPVKCKQWRKMMKRVKGQPKHRFRLAIPDGTTIPEAVSTAGGDRVLGTCDGTRCTLEMAGCGASYSYRARVAGKVVNGYRLVRLTAPPYLAGAWRAWASSDATVIWLGGLKRAWSRCVSQLGATDCARLWGAKRRCWILTDGDVCHRGRVYAPGVGGDQVCDLSLIDHEIPCVTERGPRGAEVEGAEEWTAEDLQ